MSGARSRDAMEPLAFAVLAGLTPKHHEVVFYDDRLECVPDTLSCDLAAISAGTFTAKRAYDLAGRYRNQGVKVVLGGYHPTFLPDEAAEHADAVVVGDAEGVWAQLLLDFEQGKPAKIYKSDIQPEIRDSYYDETIFNGKKYSLISPVQFSRGCKFSCEFCSVSAFYHGSIRYRRVDAVVDDIKRKKARFVLIADDNLFLDRDRTIELLTALIPLRLKWACQIGMDVVCDDEMLALLVKSGCICVLIGFETMNKENLRQMKKAANIAHSDYDKVIEKLHLYKLMIYGTFVLGYDMDTPETFDACVEFAEKSNMMLANFMPLIPMVGTRLYERFQSEGRLIYEKWWLEPDYRYGDTAFIPKGMTPQELKEGCFRIRKRFNSLGSIFRRFLGCSANREHMLIFLAANMVNRREIYRKQGRLL